jgi:hypothetical protein
MFLRQIAPFNIETILALLYIKKIIDEYGNKVNKVILDSLQWKDDKFSFNNKEKGIFVRPEILYSKSQYPIAVKTMKELREHGDRYSIGDIYLDVNKISEMIKEPGLEYMKKPLDYLIQNRKVVKIKEGEEIKDAVNILDFWGLTTLYYIGEVSRDIFGIYKYKISTFYDKILLVNKDKFDIFDISGYELTFKYKEKELRFRIYDGSHIYKEENEKYKNEGKMNSYITLALYSGNGYILLEGNPEREDQKIRDFYKEARDVTRYNILLLLVDEQPLIEKGIISEKDYVKLIGKDKIEYIIDIVRKTYGI